MTALKEQKIVGTTINSDFIIEFFSDSILITNDCIVTSAGQWTATADYHLIIAITAGLVIVIDASESLMRGKKNEM